MAAQSKPAQQQQLTPFAAALAGALGGCFSSAVVYPLDVAKTRIQAIPAARRTKDDLSMLSVLLRIYRKEGVAGLYRGFGATMLNTFSMQYAYFFFYSFVRTSYIKRLTRKLPAGAKMAPLSTATELLLGAIAGALAQIFTIPVSVIATRQQVGCIPGPPGSTEKADQSFMTVARGIIEEEGITGLWSGLKPGLVLTVNPAITYGMFERVKSLVLLARGKFGSNAKMSPWLAFLVGALSKTLATIVTYPYIMAKVRIQARSVDVDDVSAGGDRQSDDKQNRPKGRQAGAVDILARVWQREGVFGWYQGMQAQITKAVLSQALLFLSKEQFEQWVLGLMVMAARFT
ncbi:mitochondrial carrier domain-containing protein [Amanita rubescens]|nr:mitochondrial carrier domain-containing protein [Amanita rubescens]